MFAWIASVFTGGFFKALFGLGEKGIDYYLAKANGNVQEALALMAAEQQLIAARRDITLASMNHPIWWMAWALFVIPTGFHYSKVLVWDTALHLGATDPVHGYILEWAQYIVTSIFCLQVGTSIFGTLMKKLIK
jgi:hypothetical protein